MAIYKKLHKRTGVEFYYIRFEKQDGRRKKEKAGTTWKQARDLLTKRLGEVTAGTYVDPSDVDACETAVTCCWRGSGGGAWTAR